MYLYSIICKLFLFNVLRFFFFSNTFTNDIRKYLCKSGIWCIHVTMNVRTILLGPVFFRTALPCTGGYHLVGRKGATTENEGAGVKHMG